MHVISNIGKIFCGGEHISIRDGWPLVVLFLFSPEVSTKFLKAYPIYIFLLTCAYGLFQLVLGCSWVVLAFSGLFLGCSACSGLFRLLVTTGFFTASFDILNIKRLISPEREGFRGSNFDRFILGLYMFYWQCKLTYLKFGQKVVMCL